MIADEHAAIARRLREIEADRHPAPAPYRDDRIDVAILYRRTISSVFADARPDPLGELLHAIDRLKAKHVGIRPAAPPG